MRLDGKHLVSGIFAVLGVMLSAAVAQESVADSDDPKVRLEEMKRQAAEYTVTLATEPPVELSLHEEPLLRFDNPVGGVPDGIIAMWKDGQRPAILAQVFLTRDKLWIHEGQSLARAGFELRRGDAAKWTPAEGAGDFRRLKSAEPADQAAGKRLLQMKRLAAQFSATDEFKVRLSDAEATHNVLRLLPTPLYRYADKDQGIEDGAVFAFVHGTDPELFLILEQRSGGKETAGWHYCLVPMTCWEVSAKCDGKEVFSAPERLKSQPTEPYFVWVYRK
jgi:hypothetical protein